MQAHCCVCIVIKSLLSYNNGLVVDKKDYNQFAANITHGDAEHLRAILASLKELSVRISIHKS